MGQVLLARDPALEREVAIKLLLGSGTDSHEFRERFTREARAAARLTHPNIVTIYDVGDYEGQPFIAMEFVAGVTLLQMIQRRTPLPLDDKLRYLDDICAGLGHAHRAGIVHRDIKPANLMVSGDDVIKVLDFGIARLADSTMTQSGAVMGTLNYMSPEQISGRRVDHRSDIFAVGAVAYEVLSYQKAFPGGLDTGVLGRILEGTIEPLDRVATGLDRDLVRIVHRALAREPEQRFSELAAMRRELTVVRQRLAHSTHMRSEPDAPAVSSLRGSEPASEFAGDGPVDGLAADTNERAEWDSPPAFAAVAAPTEIDPPPSIAKPAQESAVARTAARTFRPPRWLAAVGLLVCIVAGYLAVRQWVLPAVARVTPVLVTTLTHDSGRLCSAVFSPDSRLLATETIIPEHGKFSDVTTDIWEVATGRKLGELKMPDSTCDTLRFSPDGRRVAYGRTSGPIHMYDVATGAESVLQGPTGNVTSVAFSSDGRMLASGRVQDSNGNAGPVTLWDLQPNRQRFVRKAPSDGRFVAFSPDDAELIANDGTRWSTATGDALPTLSVPAGIFQRGGLHQLVFRPDGRWLTLEDKTDSAHRQVFVRDAKSGQVLHEMWDRLLAFGRDGRLVSQDAAGVVHIWDSVNGPRLAFRGGAAEPFLGGRISDDGRWLLGVEGPDSPESSSKNDLRLWDLATNTRSPIPGSGYGTFSPNSTWLAAETPNGVTLWRLATEAP